MHGAERRVYADERLESVNKPRTAMFWVRHDSVVLYGLAYEERPYELIDLLVPPVLRGLVV